MDTGLSISGPAEHNNGCRDPLQTRQNMGFFIKKSNSTVNVKI
jgi:hypothetical protein